MIDYQAFVFIMDYGLITIDCLFALYNQYTAPLLNQKRKNKYK
jgi:hypothetical protein